tara:strand:- start:132 stop:344 length:213 start_codon:yes stop_codon:yes gene_type:complete
VKTQKYPTTEVYIFSSIKCKKKKRKVLLINYLKVEELNLSRDSSISFPLAPRLSALTQIGVKTQKSNKLA